jgi:hypothetical protein
MDFLRGPVSYLPADSPGKMTITGRETEIISIPNVIERTFFLTSP